MLRASQEAEAELSRGEPETVADARPVLELLSAGFEIRRFHIVRHGIWMACAVPDAAVRDEFHFPKECLVIGSTSGSEFGRELLTQASPLEWGPIDDRIRIIASIDPLAEPACAAWAAAKNVDIVLLRTVPPPEASSEDTKAALYRLLAAYLWHRDRFDDSEALRSRPEFFGNSATLDEVLRKIMAGGSVAILGLRKVGKSSLLRRVEDSLLADGMALNAVARLDGNSSRVKGGRWWNAAADVLAGWETSLQRTADAFSSKIRPKAKEFGDAIARRVVDTARLASALERDVFALVKAGRALRAEMGRDVLRLILLVDECEHLYPHIEGAGSWRADFFAFWNTLVQIKERLENRSELIFIVAGSDSSGVERGSLVDQPNPLFGTNAIYLRPLNRDDSGALLKGVGGLMGITFALDAIEYIHSTVGGHPFLLRRFGSAMHRADPGRSSTVTLNADRAAQVFRKHKREFYDQILWVLNHLRKVAPDEERLLRDIALGGVQAYQEIWKGNDLRDTYAENLKQYGLVQFQGDVPVLALQLIRDALQRPSANEFEEQKKQMKDLVDAIEGSLRSRLAVDLAKDVTISEAVHRVVSAIPADAKNRPLARQELIDLGEIHGLPAMLEAMNWGDYEILLNKFYDRIEWAQDNVERQERLSTIKITFLQAHLVRHNNDRELRELVNSEGFAAVYSRFCSVRDMFAA